MKNATHILQQLMMIKPCERKQQSCAMGTLESRNFCSGGHVVALIGENQFSVLRLVRGLPIVKPLFQRFGDGFCLTDLLLFEIGRGRKQLSFVVDCIAV